MSCFDCYKLNPQEELRRTIEAAKKAAIRDKETKIVYNDGGEFKFISERIARAEGIPSITAISQYL